MRHTMRLALRQFVDCAGAIAATSAAIAVALALAGCDNQDDASLWGDAMSPTQVQKADRGPGPAPDEIVTSEGDSANPFVDNPNYPFVDEPWWQTPEYNGG